MHPNGTLPRHAPFRVLARIGWRQRLTRRMSFARRSSDRQSVASSAGGSALETTATALSRRCGPSILGGNASTVVELDKHPDHCLTGVGRTGKWFAVEHFGVVLDVITTSKSLGGGIPLSGVTTTNAIADRVQELGYHQSSSHTDDPFLCAVGSANIQILEDEGLVENAAEQGSYLKAAFEGMMRRYEIVGDVRGIGLMLGLEIVTDKKTKTPSAPHASAISGYCRDNGLLIGHRPTGAVSGNIIRILPPLILKREEADEALAILEAAIKHAEKAVSYAPQVGTGWM